MSIPSAPVAPEPTRPGSSLDEVFRALADPSRRLLLDTLAERDGQALSELCDHLPRMTRFGVMKHLRLLEDAGVVATRKVGREKLHYLNAVPIRLIHDRWIAKYEPWAEALVNLKTALEGEELPVDCPKHVYEVFIRTTPERLWDAITSPEWTRRYFYGGVFESTWQPGAPYRTFLPDGTTPFEGTVLESDPPRRLVYTFHYVADEDTRGEQPSRVTWEIAPMCEMCKLTVVHDQFVAGETATFHRAGGGWPFILSNLKTLLETGESLPARVG